MLPWLLLVASTALAASHPPVEVSLRTSWSAPPFLVEVIETVALESPSSFFPFVDAVTDPSTLELPQNSPPEAIYRASLEVAVVNGYIADVSAISAVEMNLALHAAVPKIEAFYHHYNTTNHGRQINCGSWVDWYGTIVCDVETLARLVRVETIDPTEKPASTSTYNRPKILPFDHIYPPSRAGRYPPRTAILYASLSSPNFRELHEYLYKLAKNTDGVPLVEYVLRHVPVKESNSKTYLSGYNVALDLKKMDYLALDDRHVANNGRDEDSTNSEDLDTPQEEDVVLSLIKEYPEPAISTDGAPQELDEEQQKAYLSSLGAQAAQLIYDASHVNPIKILSGLSQNFPKYLPLLGNPQSQTPRIPISPELEAELHANQLRVQGGVNAMWLNGITVSESDTSPFGLLRLLKKERDILKTLTTLGPLASDGSRWLGNGQALDLLTHPKVAAAQNDGVNSVVDDLVDASDRVESGDDKGGKVVVWWNNLESDTRYANWQPSLHAILRPLYPGQYPSVKLNLFNIVLVVDLSQTSSINFITGAVGNIIQRNFPFRWGVAPIVGSSSDDSTKMARLFYYLVQNYGRKKTMDLLKKVSQIQVPPHHQTPSIIWDTVRSAFAELIADDDKAVDLDAILKGTAQGEDDALSHVEGSIEKARAYAQRLGLEGKGQGQGFAFVNGKYFDMSDNFLQQMQLELRNHLQYLQEALYEGRITPPSLDEAAHPDKPFSMTYHFYDLPTTAKRRNKYIVPPSNDKLKLVNLAEVLENSAFQIANGGYLYPESEDDVPLTMYVVSDLNSRDGLALVKEALLSIEGNPLARVSFLHNPVKAEIPEILKSPPVSALFAHLILNEELGSKESRMLLGALGHQTEAPGSGEQVPLTQPDYLRAVLGGMKPSSLDYTNHTKYVDMGRKFLSEVDMKPGEKGIIVNGRVIAPLGTDDFHAEDFKALQSYEMRKRVQPVVDALEEVATDMKKMDRTTRTHVISMTSSFIAAIQLPDPSEVGLFETSQRPRQRTYRSLEGTYSCFEFGDNTTALYQIGVLLDPLSETAQKWSSLLDWLSNVPNVYIEVHLNPAQYTEVPLKRFFRYNLRPALTFNENGEENRAEILFEGLPVEPIYTLAIDTPSSWLVRPREALYDLDNIQLRNLSPEDTSVEAVFELDYLVVEGHARDTLTNSPPRGVQLELVSGRDDNLVPVDDTQVVANLGYFQFKAKPGVFRLGIREGRGRDIFEMESVGNEGWDSPSVKEVGDEITVTSFEGLTLYPRLRRKKGMERADVLSEDDEDDDDGGFFGNIMDSIKSIFSSDDTEDSLVPKNGQAEINIFTVASGLLYERFVSIMILSVLRNTKSTVKFWFIENFLSPSFLEFIPHLAEAYNFQYELVTYKWPSWLRAQKEKQRIIWAYKILFLDVLFPMDLKKVIFVDADQIVRADLKELVDLDLHGAPYGYTPMGDDNYDMEGFRFWKTGYWKEFLQGRPALYVVDLVRFRQIAAGDILRGHYQALSADPGSLANLDQDLPNNLQREVPIYSLHEDWLWCETWCSKDRLHRAKTIDLCQNPLTKEPKLSRARQIPEWEEYDAEIAKFARKLAQEGKIKSRIATADANVLASAGSTSKPETSADASPPLEPTHHDGAADDQPRDEL
ncbi:glycoprotein glucosyltransferase [Moniliophthora roreri]|uniref:Glycosyltransferase family 24 protein n=1 Tax=Moniliophthora roreri TaxID=221103 RepID=A0A0W0G5Q4_MONRR|nr:glycoprotein glucosyltransferase [Moniliophthora roreri]